MTAPYRGESTISHSEPAVPSRAKPPSDGQHPRPSQPGPLEIFAALISECVPACCDDVQFELAAGGSDDVAAARGSAARGELHVEMTTAPGRAVVAVRSEPVVGEPRILGTVTCSWNDPARPNEADATVVRFIAGQAVATMRIAGLAKLVEVHRVRAANLEQALATNREIGQAIGILMATDQITADEAFDRLRSASQHLHRKLRGIAADVVQTGMLPSTVMPEAAGSPNGAASPAAR
jgi:hypothetical protein